MQDARAGQETKRTKTHGQKRAERENTRRGEGEAARPKRKPRTEAGPQNPKKNRRNTKITRKNAGAGRRALMDPFGTAKPLSHASVSRKHKGNAKPPRRFRSSQHLSQSSKANKNNSESNSYKILLISCRSRRPKKSL